MADDFIIPIDMDTAPLEAKLRRVSDLIAEISSAGDSGGGDVIGATINEDIASLTQAVALVKEFKAELTASGASGASLAPVEDARKALQSALTSARALNKELASGGGSLGSEAALAKFSEKLQSAEAQYSRFAALVQKPLSIPAAQTLVPAGEPAAPLVLQPTAPSAPTTPTPAGVNVQPGLVFAENKDLELKPTPATQRPDTTAAAKVAARQKILEELNKDATALAVQAAADTEGASVAAETTALYRGQKTAGAFGPSFTTDLERAKKYGPIVSQIDVPNDQLQSLRDASEQARQQGLHQPVGPSDFFLDEQAHPEFTPLINSAHPVTPIAPIPVDVPKIIPVEPVHPIPVDEPKVIPVVEAPPVQAPQLTKPLVEQGLITEGEANDPAVFRQVIARQQPGAGEFVPPPPPLETPEDVNGFLASETNAKSLVIEARTSLKQQYKAQAQELFDGLYDNNLIPINPTPPSAKKNIPADERARGNGAFEDGFAFQQLDPNSPVRRDQRFFSPAGVTPADLGVSLGAEFPPDADEKFNDVIAKMEKIKELETAARPAVSTGFTEKNAPFAENDVTDFLRQQGFDAATSARVAPAIAFGGPPAEAARQVVQAAVPPIPVEVPVDEGPSGLDVARQRAAEVAARRAAALEAEQRVAAVAPEAIPQTILEPGQQSFPVASRPVTPVEAPSLPVIPEAEATQQKSLAATTGATNAESALAEILRKKVAALGQQIIAVEDATEGESQLAKAAQRAAVAKANQADRINGEKPAEPVPTKAAGPAAVPVEGTEDLSALQQVALNRAAVRQAAIDTANAAKQGPDALRGATDSSTQQKATEQADLRKEATAETAAAQEQLADSASYAQNVARIKIAFERSSNAINENLLATDSSTDATKNYAQIVARGKNIQAQLEAAINARLVNEQGYTEALASSKASQAQIALKTQEALATTDGYVESIAATKSLRTQESAKVEQLLAADSDYIEATATAANNRRLAAADTKNQTLRGVGLESSVVGQALGPDLSDEARRAAVLQGLTEEEARNVALADTAKSELQLASIKQKQILSEERIANGLATQEELDAQTTVLTNQYNRAAKERVAAIQRATFEANKAGLNGPENAGPDVVGTKFQQFQSGIASRDGSFKDPTENLQLGQFLQSRFLTTAGFAVSGIATYAAFAGIQKMITDSAALEKVLSQVKAEFQALGEGGDFSGFRAGILDISRDTGAAASDVATLAAQFKGAFGATLDNTGILNQVRSAVELSKVTGISISDIENGVTAAAVTFGTSISHIGDVVLTLQDRTGVGAKEAIAALSAMGVTASDVGLTIEQTLAIVDVAAQHSGQSGQTIAEGLNRILPSIGTKAGQIVELFQQANPSQVGNVSQALASGDTGKVFDLLGRSYDNLTQAQKNYLVSLLGGQRNAKIAIDVFKNYSEVLDDTAAAQNSAGRLSKSYGDLQDTLSQQLTRVLAAFKSIGAELLNLGLSQIIQIIASTLGLLITEVAKIIGLFGTLNSAMHGIPSTLAEIYLGFKLLTSLTPLLEKLTGVAGSLGTGGFIPGVRGKSSGTTTVFDSGAGKTAPAAETAVEDGALLGFGLKKPFQKAAKDISEEEVALGTTVEASATETAAVIETAGTTLGGALASVGAALEAFTPILAVLAIAAGVQAIVSGYSGAKSKLGSDASTILNNQGDPLGAQNQKDLQKYADDREKARDPGVGLSNLNPLTSLKELGGQFAAVGSKTPDQVALDQVQKTTSKDFATVVQSSGLSADQIDALRQQANLQAGNLFSGGVSASDLTDIAKNGTTNDKKSEDIRQLFLLAAKASKKNLGDAFEAIEQPQRDLKKAADDSLQELTDLPTLQTQLSTGQITSESFVAQGKRLVDNLKPLLANAIKGGDPTQIAAIKTQLDQAQQATLQALDARVKDLTQLGLNATTVQGTGAEGVNVLTISADIAALKTPNALSSPNSVAVATAVVKAQQTQLQYMADHAASAKDAQAILDAGFKIDPAVLQELEIDNLNKLPADLDSALKESALIAGGDFETVIENIVKTKGGLAAGVATYIATLQKRIAEFKALGGHDADIAKLETDIGLLGGLVNAVKVPDQGKAADVVAPTRDEFQTASDALDNAKASQNPAAAALLAVSQAQRTADEAAARAADTQGTVASREKGRVDYLNAEKTVVTANQQLIDVFNNDAQSRIALVASLADGDPVKQAQAAIDGATLQIQQAQGKGEAAMNAAKAALNSANFQMEQAIEAIATAQAGVATAMADGDPIKQAQAALQAAQIQAQNAHGAAEQLDAAAAEINAQHQLRDALNALADSQQNIVIALLNAAGDTVGAARATLAEDQNALKRYLAQHPGATTSNDATAAADFQKVITDQAAARDALLQQQEGDIDFELNVNKISTGQAVARYQQLLATANLTEAERQQIEEKLYELKQQLGKDLQFNLPSDLRLPTLYEARRLDQSGGNYQDNRVITVQVDGSKHTNPQQTADAIATAIAAPPRFGVRARSY